MRDTISEVTVRSLNQKRAQVLDLVLTHGLFAVFVVEKRGEMHFLLDTVGVVT